MYWAIQAANATKLGLPSTPLIDQLAHKKVLSGQNYKLLKKGVY